MEFSVLTHLRPRQPGCNAWRHVGDPASEDPAVERPPPASKRAGMNSLALPVQQGLGGDPHAGELYVFRGRRGDLVKILWHDGLGMLLCAERIDWVCQITDRRQRVQVPSDEGVVGHIGPESCEAGASAMRSTRCLSPCSPRGDGVDRRQSGIPSHSWNVRASAPPLLMLDLSGMADV